MHLDTPQDLHACADQLEQLAPLVAAILERAVPLEEAHHRAVTEAGAIVGGLTDEETEQGIEGATGWRRFYTAADHLADLLGDRVAEILERRLEAHLAPLPGWESS